MKKALLTFALLLIAVQAHALPTRFNQLMTRSGTSDPTCATASGNGDICAADAIEAEGALDVAGATTLTGAVTMAGNATVGGTLGVTGVTTFTGAISSPTVATHLVHIRFCGNGPNATTAWYMRALTPADEGTDHTFGAAACDDNDHATEATIDEVYHAALSIKPVAMVCAVGAGGTDDVMTFQLRDDAADADADMTCNVTLDGAIQQCSVRDSTPTAIAATSTIAIETVNSTDDDTSAVAIECNVWATY